MKKLFSVLLMMVFSAASIHAQTNKQSKVRSTKQKHIARQYTCSMHPEIIRNKPGKCPKCGMKLISVKKNNIVADKPRYPTVTY